MKKDLSLTEKRNSTFGIGLKRMTSIYKILGYNLQKENIKLKLKHKKKINKIIKFYTSSNTLKAKVKQAIEFYTKLKTYRGIRHFKNYPVRGQRTRTNAKTRKKLK